MRNQVGTLVIAGLMTLAIPAIAQTGTAVVRTAPGIVTGSQTVGITATVTAINAATREVTLKGPQGNEVVVAAGPEVKNFAQIKVGDKVNAQYVEALMLELKKGSTAPISRVDEGTASAAKPGERPAGIAGRRITVVAEVVALDAANQVVTLRGPQQTVGLKVNDPAQFKLLTIGDRVEGTYTEALAIAIVPAQK